MYSLASMASESENLSSTLNKVRQSMEDEYKALGSKIQTVPPCIRGGEDKYAEYYRPKLIAIGPIHHNDPKLKRGENYKLMWAAMYTEQNRQDPKVLYKKVLDKISHTRKLFSWDDIKRGNDWKDEELAMMLFVDGCAILQILDKGNLSRPEELNVKVDHLVLVQRDLLLLENQLPYEVLKLLVEDETKLMIFMLGFCELQNMFTVLSDSSQTPFFKDPQKLINKIKYSPPIHLLDCLRTTILSHGIEQQVHMDTSQAETLQKIRARADAMANYYNISKEASGSMEEGAAGEPVRAINWLTVAYTYEHRKNEAWKTYTTIGELKASAIRMKRQENASLTNIRFSSSIRGGRLHLPPLILNDSTVPTLLNLVAHEMCPDFRNRFEISSYIKLLDLLVDHPDDVKELREAGILHNSLKNDEEVSELFNTIGSGLVHNPSLYYGIRKEMEKHYGKTFIVKFSIWFASFCQTYFRSPWSFISLVAAIVLLALTCIQTWKAF